MSALSFSDPSGFLLFALEVVLKGSLVLAAAGLATSLLRKSPAAVRHTIWTTALAMIVILPVIVAYTPKVDVGVLPAGEAEVIAPTVQADAQRFAERESRVGTRTTARADARAPSDMPRHYSQAPSPSLAATPVAIAQPGSPARAPGFDWKLGLLSIWAAGVTMVFFRYVIGWIALMRIKKRSEPVADVRFRLAAIKVSRSMGLNRRVRFVWGDTGGMPLTWGWIRPTVLLPQDAREWEPEKILSVLRHELAHIKRYDCFVQGLVYLVCAAYWFNPLVWVAAANSRREREMACDDYVLTSGTTGSAYADHLLDIARSLRTTRMSGVSTIAMARPSELEGRLMAILNSERDRGVNTKTGMFATMGVLAVVAIPLAALRPVPADITHLSREDVTATVEVQPIPEPDVDVDVDLAPMLLLETEDYLAQVNEIVEQATRTLESLERLEPTVSVWQAEFGRTGEDLPPSVLGLVIINPDTISLAQMRRLKAAGVDADYIEKLASVGLDRLTVDQLVSFAFADVDPDFVAEMKRAGYTDLTADEMIKLGHAGIDAEFIRDMSELGLSGLSTEDLVKLGHADVDAEFVLAMRSTGYSKLTSADLIRMAYADVEPDFVHEMAKAGYADLTPDELIRLGHADVDADFIGELRDLGFDINDVDEIVRLKYVEIDPEYVQRVRKALDEN